MQSNSMLQWQTFEDHALWASQVACCSAMRCDMPGHRFSLPCKLATHALVLIFRHVHLPVAKHASLHQLNTTATPFRNTYGASMRSLTDPMSVLNASWLEAADGQAC